MREYFQRNILRLCAVPCQPYGRVASVPEFVSNRVPVVQALADADRVKDAAVWRVGVVALDFLGAIFDVESVKAVFEGEFERGVGGGHVSG